MDYETINRVEKLVSGELFLGIESGGNPFYEYIYREASGVYWDKEKKGFKSTPMKEWNVPKWYGQICSVVKASLGVELRLGKSVEWVGIDGQERSDVEKI